MAASTNYGTGRRKSATARVHLSPGKGQITINDRPLLLPPNVNISANLTALQSHPRHRGADSLTWRPSRWIIPVADRAIGVETLFVPAKGTFLPWSESDGARVCPGKKFVQV